MCTFWPKTCQECQCLLKVTLLQNPRNHKRNHLKYNQAHGIKLTDHQEKSQRPGSSMILTRRSQFAQIQKLPAMMYTSEWRQEFWSGIPMASMLAIVFILSSCRIEIPNQSNKQRHQGPKLFVIIKNKIFWIQPYRTTSKMEEETQLLKQHLVTVVWQTEYHSSDWTISKRTHKRESKAVKLPMIS